MRISVLSLSLFSLLFFLLPSLLVPGPAAAETLPPGTHTRKVTTPDGLVRDYLLHVPPGRARPRPLVIAMHGGGSNMSGLRELAGLDELADRDGVLVAYPNGVLRTWNAGGCCVFARALGIDDVTFLDMLIDSLVRAGLADPHRIHLTGFSNGGGMAYRYACERPGRVASVGVVSGALGTPCKPERRVPVITFHGTWDILVPYGGGGNMDLGSDTPFAPVEETIDFWRRINRQPPFGPPVLDEAWTQCRTTGPRHVAEVMFCKITGGGHEWHRGGGLIGVDLTPVLWDFFARHRRGFPAPPSPSPSQGSQ
ncbi:hypothetical protein DPM19_08605 [Actinomadura craniellae]|uniref:Polyhydroxybutyrate depolymerase n=1 Tax=Actinomadura craniellae TaxID=2231787 RepID=A0A365H9Y8_9ACTN|nr:PHB depolymerase family esterase [Actinomadura craniellae]RAY15818.1 hypothetical protein DPM19_08605 [Actinomadura craniellae]